MGEETRFEFATAGRILFGRGRLAEVGPLAAALGERAFVVTGATPARVRPLLDLLEAEGLDAVTFSASGEPSLDTVREGASAARASERDLVIGMGGGSAIDAGKAIAALLTNPGDPLDYLEVIGAGRPLAEPPIPYIAIPTTAGTGAEVARNAVLTAAEHRTKVSMRSPLLLPRLAVVDPELTCSLPPEVTAYTGLDALTQLIEPLVCTRASPLVDGICREGIGRAARSLRRAVEHGGDVEARTDMSLASLFGGIALTNAGLGAVHGFAGPLGGMLGAPHGAICGRLLPHVMAANIAALEGQHPRSRALARYEEIARIVTGRPEATAADGAAWSAELVSGLAVPPLSHWGMAGDDIPEAVEKARRASSMRGNPVRLTADQMAGVLTEAL
jgi:alcohol dehydrogenase class IV